LNKFCVYVHRRKDTQEIFYVGQGTETRAYSKFSRNKQWHNIANTFSYNVEFLQKNLSKQEALKQEKHYISLYSNLVNNKTASSTVIKLDYDLFNTWFYIDSTSPTGLRWKKDNNTNSTVNRKKAGDIAGRLLKRRNGSPSAWQLSFFSKNYYVHRIVYLLYNKFISNELLIDHKDNNPLNNTINNLREVTYQKNALNTLIRNDNTSGIKGVSLNTMSGVLYYTSTWYENGKQKAKNFSVKKYGNELALQLATEHRKKHE